MKVRSTITLIVLAVVVGVIVLVNPFKKQPEVKQDPPWFYNVTSDDISQIEITTRFSSETFIKVAPGQWHFEEPEGIPVNNERWSGIPLLLSGPQSQRILYDSIDDPDNFGLARPTAAINVSLSNQEVLTVILGDETPDGAAHYAQMKGFPQLFLIDSSWGQVLTRIVDVPPIPKWYLRAKDPSVITGVDLIVGGKQVEFRKEDDVWKFEDGSAIDEDRWQEVLPLLNGPTLFLVVEERVNDPGPWGVDENSDSISIRFKAQTERGVEYNDTATFVIGNDAPDPNEQYMYADGYGVVLILDSHWVEVLRRLGEDPPYAQSF